MQKTGGNDEHPLNDPLWNGFTVQWFLTDRPTFTDEQRHNAQSVSQSRYYKKRKAVQEEHAEEMKALYEAGQITDDEYKKYLIGDKRRQFITETKTKKRIKAEMTTEMKSMRQDMGNRLNDERNLRSNIEKKLQDLRSQLTSADVNSNSADIEALENARNKLDLTQAKVEAYKEILSELATNVVNLWADDQFLATSHMTYLQYYNFQWPTEVSEKSFYVFATLLCPKTKWDGQIRSPSSIRHMQLELRDYIKSEKEQAAMEDGILKLDQLTATFTSSIDVVKNNEQQAGSMSQDGAQRWVDDQDRLWEDAKKEFQTRFALDAHAPIQYIRLINEFGNTWRAQKDAEKQNSSARAAASGLV
jgi:hypothetical protein